MKHIRLDRKRKILLNLALILLFSFLIWAMGGYKLYSPKAEKARLEAAYLLPSGEILTTIDTQSNGPSFLVVDGGITIGLCRMPKSSLTASYDSAMYLYERQGGITAMPLPSRIYGSTNNRYRGCILVFDNVPEAQAARLTFTVQGETFEAEGRRETDGLFVLYYEAEDTLGNYDILANLQRGSAAAVYTVSFYDIEGNYLGEYDAPPAKLAASSTY